MPGVKCFTTPVFLLVDVQTVALNTCNFTLFPFAPYVWRGSTITGFAFSVVFPFFTGVEVLFPLFFRAFSSGRRISGF